MAKSIVFSPDEEKDIISMYDNKASCSKIGRKYNVDYGVIIRFLRRKGIVVRDNNSLSPTQRDEAIKMYQENKNYSATDVANILNVDKQIIQSLLRKRGIKIEDNRKNKRLYTLNHNFFETIDTEAKAYFLGLMYADGCNYYPKYTFAALALQEEDKHILETFSKEIESNKPLLFRKAAKTHWKNVFRIDINSKKMCNDLTNLGCMSKKTYKLQFPTKEQVPTYLIHHFIRGYMDGDGCICYTKCFNRKKCYTLKVGFSSCLVFLEGLKECLKNELNISLYIAKARANTSSLCRESSITGKYDSIKLLNWLYKDATIFFFRKHQKYKDALKNEEFNLKKRNLLA